MKIASLIDISCESDNNDKIYADLTSNEFGDPRVEQELWGEYSRKPQAKSLFQVQVREAVDSIVAAAEKENTDFRPRIKDLHTNTYF